MIGRSKVNKWLNGILLVVRAYGLPKKKIKQTSKFNQIDFSANCFVLLPLRIILPRTDQHDKSAAIAQSGIE